MTDLEGGPGGGRSLALGGWRTTELGVLGGLDPVLGGLGPVLGGLVPVLGGLVPVLPSTFCISP